MNWYYLIFLYTCKYKTSYKPRYVQVILGYSLNNLKNNTDTCNRNGQNVSNTCLPARVVSMTVTMITDAPKLLEEYI